MFNHEILSIIQANRSLSSRELAKRIVNAAHDKVVSSKKVQTPY